MMNKPKYKTIIQTELVSATNDLMGFQDYINEFAKTHHVVGIKYQSFMFHGNIKDRALIMYKVRVEVEDE